MLRSRGRDFLLSGRPRRGLLADSYRGPRLQQVSQVGATLASSRGTSLTSGSANTKGSWVELEASCPFDVDGFWVSFFNVTSRGRQFVDIGIGAAASEVVLVPNVPFVGAVDATLGSFYVPIRIAAGERISARSQGAGASYVADIALLLCAGEQYAAGSCRRATAYGHVLASTTSDCAPDPDNTAHTKGPYDELAASITNPMKAWTLFVTSQGQDVSPGRFYVSDLAVGGAGSEVPILADVPSIMGANGDWHDPPAWGPFWLPVDAGSRLSVRSQCSAASTVPGTYCYVLGFD